MSYTYSQALVAAFSADNSSDTEQSAPLKSNLTQEPFLWHDKTMVLSLRSQFGMMCEPLTESLGEALLTWFVAGFHAKTSAQQVKEQELTANEAECGLKCSGLLAKYDPATHSLKTAQCSLLEDLTGCSLTLPRWGTIQNGGLWGRQTWGGSIGATEYGLSLPTPKKSDAFQARMKMQNFKRPESITHDFGMSNIDEYLSNQYQRRHSPRLSETMMQWPDGQTDLLPLATDKFQEWRQQHSPSLNSD
jgi:hypothetical protein